MNYTNLEEVTNEALKTGEKIRTLECPCCHKIYFALESEATYERANRTEDDYKVDPKQFSLKSLGRKCPHCGFVSSLSPSDLFSDVPKEAGQELAEKETPWSVINNMRI